MPETKQKKKVVFDAFTIKLLSGTVRLRTRYHSKSRMGLVRAIEGEWLGKGEILAPAVLMQLTLSYLGSSAFVDKVRTAL